MRVILFVIAIVVFAVGCMATSTPDTSETTGETRCETCDPGDGEDSLVTAADFTGYEFSVLYPNTQRTGITCGPRPGLAGIVCVTHFDLDADREFQCEVQLVTTTVIAYAHCQTCDYSADDGHPVCTVHEI